MTKHAKKCTCKRKKDAHYSKIKTRLPAGELKSFGTRRGWRRENTTA